MLIKNTIKPHLFILAGFLFLLAGFSYAQESDAGSYNASFENGTNYYKEGRWQDAAAEFRRAQESTDDRKEWSEALYWVIMSELSAADYGSALRDMDELEKAGCERSTDIPYHRGRAYYYLGYFEDAILQFKQYNDSSNDEMRKATAYFWMGECLFSMGQLDKASEFYAWVMSKYPASSKIEACSYRLDIIKQKKIEAELLMLLKWSHEESLRTSEDYQQKIKIYESTLIAYQKRLANQYGEDYDAEQNRTNLNPPTYYQEGDPLERAKRLRAELERGINTLENRSRGNN